VAKAKKKKTKTKTKPKKKARPKASARKLAALKKLNAPNPPKADRSKLFDEKFEKLTLNWDFAKKKVDTLITGSKKKRSVDRFAKGVSAAKEEITPLLEEISAISGAHFEVKRIQLTLSFNSNGDFIGFGKPGALQIGITLKPS